MSVLRSLFGKRDLDTLLREADALFDEGRFGDAKLAYDRLADRTRKEQPGKLGHVEARTDTCCDELALARANEAIRLARDGARDLAKEELRHALETARSDDAKRKVRGHIDSVERAEAQAEARDDVRSVAPLSDEEQLMLITSSWEPAQASELERHGEPLLEALLATERGDGARAMTLLAPLRDATPDATYLWLEIGRAELARGALAEAEAALRTFLKRLGDDDHEGGRLLAHRELARIAHERGDRDAAVAELEACAEAMEDDPRPYLDLGNYLRLIERPREAIEVLELCAGLFPDGAVEWPVTLELGLACAAAGEDARAISLLEGVLTMLLGQGHDEVPPIAGAALAKLHEKAGNLARAADLYRMLGAGSDTAQRAHYHEEASRLLDVLGLTDEAARLRERVRLDAAPAGAERARNDAVDTAKTSV